jgi:hypothetical protein
MRLGVWVVLEVSLLSVIVAQFFRGQVHEPRVDNKAVGR